MKAFRGTFAATGDCRVLAQAPATQDEKTPEARRKTHHLRRWLLGQNRCDDATRGWPAHKFDAYVHAGIAKTMPRQSAATSRQTLPT